MKYKSFTINKEKVIREGKFEEYYVIYEPFIKDKVFEGIFYKTISECKNRIDKLEEHNKSNRYMPVHYSRFFWAVMDKKTALYIRKQQNKLVTFKNYEQARKWCNEMNKNFKI